MATLPRSSNTPTAARTPRPELRRHLSFATSATSSPEFHVSPELRRHPSFTTSDPPFSELYLRQRLVVTCRHQRFATRAPPSPVLHLPSELHLRLPRLHHSMPSPFQATTNGKETFFLATTTGPGVATLYSDNLEIISPTSAAVHRWACRFKPLLGARHHLSGHYHQLRRHQPSPSTSWNKFCRLLQPPRR